nr:MAG TPA: hypothetical protein [Caudoviricetes sp.]DAY70595.1 MAG TPA: hypothetical protein [Caudoviricetes sp.]
MLGNCHICGGFNSDKENTRVTVGYLAINYK